MAEKDIAPEVSKTISSPEAGAVPPQFVPKVQSLPEPIPPAQVLVAPFMFPNDNSKKKITKFFVKLKPLVSLTG